MNAVIPSQVERTEMEHVLQSGIFDKAPRLGRFFCYICDRYFAGDADQIKEYSIALEALGRTEEFDPKKDSIVRVEAHRLRKRLDDYYRGPGAGHQLRISIPNGQYRPVFIAVEPEPREPESAGAAGASLAEIVNLEGEATEAPPAPPPKSWLESGGRVPFLVSVVLIGLLGVLVLLRPFHKTAAARPALAEEFWTGTAADPPPAEFRILVGYHGAPFVDRQGHTWQPDAFYSGGVSEPIPTDHYIEGQPDPHLLRAQRTGKFHYDIPLGSGTHELRLYFAETEFGRGNAEPGGEGSRTFQLAVNGVTRSGLLDPLADAGAPNRLHQLVMKDVTPGNDGKLHLNFMPVTRQPLLNAIEILPSPPGRIHPIRIVTQPNSVTDSDGRLWAADEYFSGGTMVFRRNLVLNPLEKALYQGERYGNFSYLLPLASGKYRLTLHFAETWFGTPESGLPALGERSFDVYANGVALLRNYEVVKDAGGPNRSVDKVFEKMQPDAQGVLRLEFVPVKNYAEVNAIEVVETE